MIFDVEKYARPNVVKLQPYASARQEYKGKASIHLDANENPYEEMHGLNRYPDPLQVELKAKIAGMKGIGTEQVFIGNGSDEVIDLALRIFCEPGKDKVIVCPPTYGMYEVSAGINNVELVKVRLDNNFQPDVEGILKAKGADTRLLFLCSPNNPTGNALSRKVIMQLLDSFDGLVIIDEAYIDYSEQTSCLTLLERYPNLLVLQTLSKAWGLAGLRLGLGIAAKPVVDLFNKVKPPYNISSLSQQMALESLDKQREMEMQVSFVKLEREKLAGWLAAYSFVKKVFPSDANFLLLLVTDVKDLYNYLLCNGIVTRNRNNDIPGALRISIGTPIQNQYLIQILNSYDR